MYLMSHRGDLWVMFEEVTIQREEVSESVSACELKRNLTCLMAVTVITKNKGRPLVTGLVGVSTIT